MASKTVLEIFYMFEIFIFWKDEKSVFLGCNQKLADLLNLGDKKNIVGLTDYDLPWKKEESDYFLPHLQNYKDQSLQVL